MDSRFAELTQFMLGIVGAFAALVAITIGFALWGRRTTLRPLEDRVKAVEAEQARDRERLDSLLEVFRSLGRGDERVADYATAVPAVVSVRSVFLSSTPALRNRELPM